MKLSEETSIPVNILRQYIFCPRIPYFTEVLGITPEKPLWVDQGQHFHKVQIDLNKHRKLKRFGLSEAKTEYNVVLNSQKLGIHGVADIILITQDSVFPVEIKISFSPFYKGHVLQAIAYGVMAQEKYSRNFSTAFIMHSQKGEVKSFAFNKQWDDLLAKTVKGLREIITSGLMPDSSASLPQCGQCEFLNFCNDRF
jgi:CRISPR-associated exonuclease Cas4